MNVQPPKNHTFMNVQPICDGNPRRFAPTSRQQEWTKNRTATTPLPSVMKADLSLPCDCSMPFEWMFVSVASVDRSEFIPLREEPFDGTR